CTTRAPPAPTAFPYTTLFRSEGRQNRVQALWLARSGGELAAARLLTDPDGYVGEVVELIPEGHVRIVVQPDPGRPDTFHIRCERSEEHTSELQSRGHIVCRLL